MWFEELTGFAEESPQQVRSNLELQGNAIRSRINGRKLICGHLSVPSLADLRLALQTGPAEPGRLTVNEAIADISDLHQDPENEGAFFQVASQFNLLEMVSPVVSPEQGVGIYERDRTQGPACAIAAGAGTIYRNYFVKVNGRTGQSADNQIDCLSDIGQLLGNAGSRYWTMENGYALLTRDGVANVCHKLDAMDEPARDQVRSLLRIGLQHNTQVTILQSDHLVSQAYCSALPVAYSEFAADQWEPFARIVLEAAYEATLAAAEIHRRQSGCRKVYLTLLGGGAFGNRLDWIADAIRRAGNLFYNCPLEVMIVSRSRSHPLISELITATFEGSQNQTCMGSTSTGPNVFAELTDIQKSRFKSLSGYEYDGKSLSGSFITDRPYDDDWDLSPWHFRFEFDQQTGHLYCELDHRMTNNRAHGWDQDGNELSRELVEKVFPSHM